MATLILEIPSRHGSQYHKITQPVVRVGRALDNDIILSDPSVSPYHLVMRRNDAGEHELHSLADENGVRVGRRLIQEPVKLTDLPLEIVIGRTHLRILDLTQTVAPTRLISCRDGGICIFGHWGWALLLFAGLVLLSAIDNYLSTPEKLSWKSYGHDQLIIVLAALTLSAGLLAVNRLTSQRWDYPAALSLVSLLLISALLLDQFIPFADYLFTSPLPGFLISLAWSIVLVPLALAWFLIRLNHGSTAASLLFIFVILTPVAYVQIRDIADHFDWLGDFSKQAFYSDALYPWDRRLQKTISIEEFARTSTQTVLPDVQK